MKICTANSSRGPHCQIMRIEDGFRSLGHEIVSDMREADLIYQNNFWFDDILAAKSRGEIKAKIILNVLDVPEHIIHEFDLDKAMRQLKQANAVTSISQFVYGQVEKFFGIKSHIIYQPIMPVGISDFNEIYNNNTYKYLHVGRRYDPNKRFMYMVQALRTLNVSESEIGLIGPELVSYGKNLGSISIKHLEQLYIKADFTFVLGRIEGIALSMLESMACGCIPVIFNDLTTRQEFLPSSAFPEYDSIYPDGKSLTEFISRYQFDVSAKEDFKARLLKHYQNNWEYNMSGVGVAQKIINVYKTLL